MLLAPAHLAAVLMPLALTPLVLPLAPVLVLTLLVLPLTSRLPLVALSVSVPSWLRSCKRIDRIVCSF
jgi:hypothetical protein